MTKQNIKAKSIINSSIMQINGDLQLSKNELIKEGDDFDWNELKRSMLSQESISIYGEKNVHLKDIFIFQEAELKRSGYWIWEDIGDLKEYLYNFNYENAGWEKKPIILYGDFGIGKSSFLRIFSTFLVKENFKYLPILVPLRELPLYSKDNLLIAIKEYLKIYGNFNFKSDKKILFIFDGFDELNFYSDDEDWIKRSFEQLVGLLRYKNIRIIISSRPILFLKQEENIPSNSYIFKIKEFNEKQIEEWIMKWIEIPQNEKTRLSLNELKAKKLINLVKNPLLLYMTAKIFDSEAQALTSYSTGLIYKLFYDWTIKGKYKEDKQSYRLPSNYRNVLQNIAMTIRYIGRNEEFISYDTLKKNIIEFQEETLDKSFFNISEIVLVAHFFKIEEREELKYIEFAHKSFREYLIAEKFFDFFEDCIQKNNFNLSAWVSMGRHLPSKEEIIFLKDLLYTLTDDNLLWLYDKFTLYTPLLVATGNLRKILEEIHFPEKTEFSSIYYRSINLSTLAFILGNIIYFRLKKNWDTLLKNNKKITYRGPFLNYIYHICHSIPMITKSDEPLKEYQKNWSTAKSFLSGIKLSNLNLDGVDFSNADIDDCSFYNSSIRRCSFVNSKLILTDLSYAICDGSDFSKSYCHTAKFINTYLNQINFNNALIYHVDFINTEFNNVDFSGTSFDNCNFKDCKFNNVNLEKIKTMNCNGLS